MGKKKTKKKRSRTVRRDAARRANKLTEARRKLQAVEPGGHVDNPIEVAATSQIDSRVRALPCVACEGAMSHEHEAGSVRAGRVIRTMDLRCRRCSERRTVYFAVATTPMLN